MENSTTETIKQRDGFDIELDFDHDTGNLTVCQYGTIHEMSEQEAVRMANVIMNYYYTDSI